MNFSVAVEDSITTRESVNAFGLSLERSSGMIFPILVLIEEYPLTSEEFPLT